MTPPPLNRFRSSLLPVALLWANLFLTATAPATILFQSGANENNFIPFGVDGTPNRPAPGTSIATQITTGGALLNQVSATFGTNNSTGNAIPQTDVYTLQLYGNDGALGPNGSGLRGPGTLIFQTTTSASNSGGIYTVIFATPVTVPATYILALSSTHPTDTFFGSAGLVGPLSTTSAPVVGSALNTLWYSSSKTGGWETNSSWATADGASTNYLSLKIDGSIITTVPEPAASLLLVFAAGCCFGSRIVWRSRDSTPRSH